MITAAQQKERYEANKLAMSLVFDRDITIVEIARRTGYKVGTIGRMIWRLRNKGVVVPSR